MENTQNKKRYNLTNVSFNRYLVFRYITAIFFFINLYWMILSFETIRSGNVLPILLFLVDIAIIIEQTAKYWNPSNRLTVTRIGYGIQIGSNLFILLMILVGHQHIFFPFINEKGQTILILFLLVGCVVSTFIEWRAWQIEHDKDAYLTYMETIKKTMKENG